MAAASPWITYSDFQGKLQLIISAYYVENQVSVARERPFNARSVAVPSGNPAVHCLYYFLVHGRSGLKIFQSFEIPGRRKAAHRTQPLSAPATGSVLDASLSSEVSE